MFLKSNTSSYLITPILFSPAIEIINNNNNGATAAAGTFPSLIVSALNDLDSDSLAVFNSVLDLQAVALSLLSIHTCQMLEAMDVEVMSHDSLPISSLPCPMETVESDGHPFTIIYPVEPQPENSLVLPGKIEAGVFHAIYRDITGSKRPELVELCKQYSLGSVGKKDELKKRLAGFSENKIRWQSLVPNAHRAHRGVRAGGIVKRKLEISSISLSSAHKVKKLKPSTVRRNGLMGLPPNTPLGVQLFDTERSKDMRTLEEKNALYHWAKRFCDTHPYITREELQRRQDLKEVERAKEKATSATMVADYMQSMSNQIASLTATIQMLTLPQTQRLPVDTQVQAMPTNPTPANATPTNITLTNATPTNATPTNTMPTNATLTNAILTNAIPTNAIPMNGMVYKLTIGRGQVIQYRYSDVREPRQISFATNIPRLDRVWDDDCSNWDPVDCGKNLLEINGTAIAVRYWQEVFSGKKHSAWSWLKKLWTEWKYVIERYRSSTPDNFWEEFSFSNGQRFHWKAITDRLRYLRSEQEQKLVDIANAEYGERFSQVFVNNRGKVLSDKSAIARRYLTLSNNST
ncbi:hypothetical protein DFJ43DRAFT_1157148 [Lentinula guzmanii]|uniref:SAP domain-containing protein n=1 Tax=Lentinula guzmanii TaxID=2804957 RepID=A0AA38MXL2_9AGAR|nr:hypothetical protein DFJ43DRAFT_1157148 [Lentinula guzmanii]